MRICCVLFVRAQRTSNLFSDQMSGRDLVPPIGASVTTSASRHGVNPGVGLHGDREAQSVPGDTEDFLDETKRSGILSRTLDFSCN